MKDKATKVTIAEAGSPLPGEPTEEEIADILDRHHPQRLPPGDLKMAAVLMPLIQENGGWSILLTRRTDTVEHHKGEISFPGGHRDEDDPDLEFTALRETEEEVGIKPEQVRILGRLDDIYTITGFRIRPFVAKISPPVTLRPAPAEIAEIIILPVAQFMNKTRFSCSSFIRDKTTYPIYQFKFDGFVVWGATARVIVQFLELCTGFTNE